MKTQEYLIGSIGEVTKDLERETNGKVHGYYVKWDKEKDIVEVIAQVNIPEPKEVKVIKLNPDEQV